MHNLQLPPQQVISRLQDSLHPGEKPYPLPAQWRGTADFLKCIEGCFTHGGGASRSGKPFFFE